MIRRNVAERMSFMALPLVTAVCLIAVCQAQDPAGQGPIREPVYRVNKTVAHEETETSTPQTQEHPLAPAVRVASEGLESIRANVQDYTCTLVKREEVEGVLLDPEYIFMKVRHENRDADGNKIHPFSVYMYFVKPDKRRGREVMYIEGENDGRLIAHEGSGVISKFTAALEPESKMAMEDNRYPITNIGIENLIIRLLEVAERDMQYGECEVDFFDGAKINGRVAKCIQVVHPVPRKNFRFHIARIFIDKEANVPIRFASYDWPKEKGGKPVLQEEYTYLNMKLNVGLTDDDFSLDNPNYKFTKPVLKM